MAQSSLSVLFIAGSGRSGSTLLDRLLGNLPETLSLGEVGNFGHFCLEPDDRPCSCGKPYNECCLWAPVTLVFKQTHPNVTPDSWQKLKSKTQGVRNLPFLLFPSLRSHPFQNSLEELTRLFETIFKSAAEQTHSHRIIDSSKGIPHALMLRESPRHHVQVLHLVRDPRAVAYSWMRSKQDPGQNKLMPKRSLIHACLRWWRANLIVHLSTGVLPTLRIRYEDLCLKSSATFQQISQFANVSEKHKSWPVSENKTSHLMGGNPAKYKPLSFPIKVDEAWIEELDFFAKITITVLCLPLLLFYRYPIFPVKTSV
ncbi:MAG: sulfotransferase [Verrucomicrobiota bacterium]